MAGHQRLFVHAPDDGDMGKVVHLDAAEKEFAFSHSVAEREIAGLEGMKCQRAYPELDTRVLAMRRDSRFSW